MCERRSPVSRSLSPFVTMAHRQSQPDQSAWPKYFLPRPGKEHAAREAQARIPATLMDLLYIQDPMTGAAQLVALLGCLGGHMLVVPDGAFTTLPDDLQRHIKTVEVDQRGIFRAIRARELYVLVLDAIDQDVAVQGFNDPVYLFSRMQAKIVTTAGSLQTAPLANEGRLAVGRLDMLHAYQQSLGCALANPLAPNEHTYQFLLPAAPRQEIEQGSGIVLIYPMLDPLTINSSDNSFIVMRLVYEVLARLQQDMVDEGIDHPFTRLAVPVPSRGRLESELMAEGYEIKGEYAIKQRQATGTQTGGFLSHLRQLAARWSEPRILLPDQARPEVYSDTVDAAVENLALAMYMDGSDSMRSAGNYGRGGGILARFGRQRNPVQEVMRSIVPHLAVLDATGTCRVVYWATGPGGRLIEAIGEMNAQQAETAEFPGPGQFRGGTHLLPAIRDFVSYIQQLMQGGEKINVAFGVIVTDGQFHDQEEVIEYTRTALIPAIQQGKFPRTAFTLVGVGRQADPEQLEELEHESAPEGYGEHKKGIFCYAMADEISQVPQLVSHLLDANAPAFYGGAVIRDQNGQIVATFEDMVPVVVEFQIPLADREVSFAIEAGDQVIKQRVQVVEAEHDED